MQRADVHGKLHVLSVLSTSIAARLAETDGNGSLALQVDLFLPATSATY